MKIQHVQQPCDNSCVMACISMLSGITVKNLQDRLEMKFPPSVQAIDWILYEIFGARFHRQVHISITVPGFYMVSVPSINIEGSMHCILLEVFEDNTYKVYDPNQGRRNKRAYTELLNPASMEVTLTSWSEVIRFDPPGDKVSALAEENRRLREIICECADVLDNGSVISPDCSIGFMEVMPREIRAVLNRLSS